MLMMAFLSGVTVTVTRMGGTGAMETETGLAPEEGKFPGATGLRYTCQKPDLDEVGLIGGAGMRLSGRLGTSADIHRPLSFLLLRMIGMKWMWRRKKEDRMWKRYLRLFLLKFPAPAHPAPSSPFPPTTLCCPKHTRCHDR